MRDELSRDEAKTIIDAGAKYLQRGSYTGTIALVLSRMAGIGFLTYTFVVENGAGGNLFTSDDFDEVWAEFSKSDDPITSVDYYSKGN